MNDRSASWLFDLGNTRLKWACLDGDVLGEVHALPHAESERSDERLDRAFAEIEAGATAWLASVASDARAADVTGALERCGARVCRVHTQSGFAGVQIAYAEPARLGVDRFLALIAAHARGPRPWLIVGVGTALTLDLLDTDGTHLGGLIAPSPMLMRESLAQRAPQLPAQGGAVVDFATATLDALASGCTLMARALVERSLHAAAQRLLIRHSNRVNALPFPSAAAAGEDKGGGIDSVDSIKICAESIGAMPTLLLSGGGAMALGDNWPAPFEREPHLVLHGLRLWAQAQAG